MSCIELFFGPYALLLTDLINKLLVILHAGTPALTSRGFTEDDFAKVAEFFDGAAQLAIQVKSETKGEEITCVKWGDCFIRCNIN